MESCRGFLRRSDKAKGNQGKLRERFGWSPVIEQRLVFLPNRFGYARAMLRRPLRLAIFLGILVILAGVLLWANGSGAPLPSGAKADRIRVIKSTRTLELLHEGRVLKSYRISLGPHPIGAKEREGDGKTPEGVYRIVEHKKGSSFHRALRVSYPEERDVQRAKELHVSPGSAIMIHGIMNRLGFIGKLHLIHDWTAGCMAVTNSEIEEIWEAVDDGTIVEICP